MDYVLTDELVYDKTIVEKDVYLRVLEEEDAERVIVERHSPSVEKRAVG